MVLLFVCISQLWSTQDLAGLFSARRLQYPAGDPNSAAALFLVCFWPLVWLAAGSRERAPVRGIALGAATGLLGLAMMTQSRGAMYSLAISLVLMFVLSPGRLRLLFYLVVPALLMGYAFPRLNRYWLDGPEALGGGRAARTLLLAALAAGFIGMILALLERWILVSGRMKAIFGGVVVAACVGGLVYGAVIVTRDYGDPVDWATHAWRQFTADPANGDTTGSSSSAGVSKSRFTDISSNGRVDIWEAAWREFESSPAIGGGAGDFVYEYNRVRTVQSSSPQQAHSLALQVLGDTGVVGGIFAFGGIILALGGILWPRFSAGWSRVRRTWVRSRKEAAKARASTPSGAPPSSRWGDVPMAYGWDMALLVGAAFWFIHANVEGLWQMPGVSVPAVLMLAAGVAAVDARAGVLWPQVTRRLRWKSRASNAGTVEPTAETGGAAHEAGTAAARERAGTTEMPQPAHHSGVESSRDRRPAGEPLSRAFRIALIVLSAVAVVLAGLAFVSTQIQTSALALSRTDPLTAAGRAASARWFAPGDASPYLTQASIYSAAARIALASPYQDRAGAVLDDLALALAAGEKAIAREPANWTNYYSAAWATMDLIAAKTYAEGRGSELQATDMAGSLVDRHDWSGLPATLTIPAVGAATGSLAHGRTAAQSGQKYRDLTQNQLVELASGFIAAAQERNPLETAVAEVAQLLRKLPAS